MGTAKKIIGDIAESVGEFVKDSARQVAETVDPVKMIENAAGINKSESEFSKYLKGLGGNLTEADIEKRKRDFEGQQKKEMTEAQSVIKAALPAHLRPPPILEPSIFEKNKQEEEMKKAQMVEAQKSQPKSISAPAGKVTGQAKRKKQTGTNFEAQKNVKIG